MLGYVILGALGLWWYMSAKAPEPPAPPIATIQSVASQFLSHLQNVDKLTPAEQVQLFTETYTQLSTQLSPYLAQLGTATAAQVQAIYQKAFSTPIQFSPSLEAALIRAGVLSG